ncbi:MAG: DNA methyltransferase [Patescibacteria group bacterium]|nr:DNA methyltransferase [Patescibacteria group bacterium]MDD4610735.1 DNA methyltransferase [Patescibacteria group bacterium]
MKYFFILGNNPTLSVAEISAVFGLNNNVETRHYLVSTNVFILETDQEINTQKLIQDLGGTIKIGKIINVETPNYASLQDEIKKIIGEKINKKNPGTSRSEDRDASLTLGKFNFGISNYSNKNINTKIIGMEIKTWLKEQGISSRFVTSKEKTLSSVVVEQNKLLKNGIEIIILPNSEIGFTLAVQPFKELSYRDYGRPARDDLSGMLPPKLAQIMINLSGIKTNNLTSLQNATILDPFCGSGTIITEAMLIGFQNLIGSDISAKAIEDTRKNIGWIQNAYNLPPVSCKLINEQSSQISKKIKPASVDAIVTEPYLGPQRGKINFEKIVRELENLYSQTLKEFYKILKPNGRVVMIWPVLQNKCFLNPKLNNFKIKNSISNELKNNKFIKLTPRNTIVYGREGQKVWREIVILEKNK